MQRGRLRVEVAFYDEVAKGQIHRSDDERVCPPFSAHRPAGALVYIGLRCIDLSGYTIPVIRPVGHPTLYRDLNNSSRSWVHWFSPLEELALAAVE